MSGGLITFYFAFNDVIFSLLPAHTGGIKIKKYM